MSDEIKNAYFAVETAIIALSNCDDHPHELFGALHEIKQQLHEEAFPEEYDA